MVKADDVIKIAVLKKHVKYFAHFGKRNNLPIFKVNKNEGVELAKSALNSPVLEKLTEGLINIYRDIPKDEYIDVDAKDVEDEEESEQEPEPEFDLPPDAVGEDNAEKESEE